MLVRHKNRLPPFSGPEGMEFLFPWPHFSVQCHFLLRFQDWTFHKFCTWVLWNIVFHHFSFHTTNLNTSSTNIEFKRLHGFLLSFHSVKRVFVTQKRDIAAGDKWLGHRTRNYLGLLHSIAGNVPGLWSFLHCGQKLPKIKNDTRWNSEHYSQVKPVDSSNHLILQSTKQLCQFSFDQMRSNHVPIQNRTDKERNKYVLRWVHFYSWQARTSDVQSESFVFVILCLAADAGRPRKAVVCKMLLI